MEIPLQLSVPGRAYKLPCTIIEENGRLRLKYGFSKEMNAEVKAMQGSKYHGFEDGKPTDKKYWSVDNCPRNWFTLRHMAGEDVYKRYDIPLIDLSKPGDYVNTWEHVLEMSRHGLTKRRVIFAYEMGTGKTRGSQIIMDESGFTDWWFVGTKGSLREMSREWAKWNPKIKPRFMTYDELRKIVSDWPTGKKAPRGVFFDEASKIKSPTAQRSQAAYHLSCAIEKDWGDEGYCILMTGTPSPKDPCDWWHLCEVAKPGFIREGTYQKFKNRLSLTVQKQGDYGVYPELVTWWDDENKCAKCGKLKDANPSHNQEDAMFHSKDYHAWEPSKNEVKNLYERMKGLVVIKFKRDVMKFLPEKRYVVEEMKPSISVMRAAKTIFKTAKNAITGLTLLRALSDGFQYTETPCGLDQCPTCHGTCVARQYFSKDNPDESMFDVPADKFDSYTHKDIPCPACDAKGQITKYTRTTVEVECPKDDYFTDLLDNHDDVGRFVCYAGFTGSIDRCVKTAHKNGWATIRVDARGWHATDYQNNPIDVSTIFGTAKGDPYLRMFQEGKTDFSRVCFVGHAKSGGMGVSLTASPGIYFYSNSFDGEDRFQAEDRIHRGGMDLNRGATIYDGIHLPSDRLILDNLLKKKKLQEMTLGVFQKTMEEYTGERIL